MRSRQIYAQLTASSTGTLYFDMPDSTTIRGVNFAVSNASTAAAADYIECEVTLSSSNQTAVNDAQGIVAIAGFGSVGGGAAASVASWNGTAQCAANCPVKKGERVYLNVTEAGGGTWRVRALVWFD